MRHFRLKKQIIRSLIVFLAFILSVAPAFAIDQNTLKFYAKNNILYYDPSGTSCLPSSSASPVEGNTQIEIAWNYFVNSGIAGVYDNAAVIAGIVGNLIGETTTVDPFLDGGYCGVFQASSSSFAEIKTDVNNQVPGASSMWRRSSVGKEYSGSELELAKQAIVIELDYLTGSNGKNSSAYTPSFNNFVKTIPDVSNPSPESYAELFLIWVERAVADDDCISGTSHIDPSRLDDPGVQNVANNKIYPRNPSCQNVPYQGTYKRRDFAADVYNKYAGNTVNSLGGSSDGSTVTIIGDSITNGSRNEILNKFPSADITSEVGRPFGTGVSIASDPSKKENYKFNDAAWAVDDGMLSSELRQNVVIALGSNNPDGLSLSDIDSMLTAIGTDKNVYFVTNYMSPSTKTYASEYNKYKTGYEQNNSLFKATADSKSNVYLIDWAANVVEGDYLSSDDGLHPNGNGQKLFAELIYNAINKSTATSICDPAGSGGPATPWDGEIPWYNQCGTDSEGRSYMETKVGSSGYPDSSGYIVCHSACGVFSMASILTALSGKKIDPGDGLLDYIGKEGRFFASSKGKPYGLTNMGSHESYKKYVNEKLHQTMTYEVVSKNNYTESAYISYINNALRSGKLVWIVGNESPKHVNTPFSPGGHFVAIRGIDASGNWLVIDPNGTAGKNHTFNKTFSPSQMYQHAQTNGTAIIGIN